MKNFIKKQEHNILLDIIKCNFIKLKSQKLIL